VTTAEFGRFVHTTGYVTVAERPLDPAGYPGADPAALVPGSLVFRRPHRPVPLHDYRAWWAYIPGRPGDTPKVLRARSRGANNIRSHTSPTRMPWHTLAGREKTCRRKPSGSSRLAEDCRTPSMCGATSSPRRGGCSPTRGRGVSHGRTCGLMDSKARRLSTRFRRMGMASTTWRATSGSGPATSSHPGIHRAARSHAARPPKHSLPAASRPVHRVIHRQV
jgi:hypothetical protein